MVSRQLNYDASPQGGVEIFGIREYTVFSLDPFQSALEYWPLQSLGHGHASVVDKQAALAHAIWLQAGPALEDVRAYCSSVHCICTDLGVEKDVGDAPDFLVAYLTGDTDIVDAKSYMFPEALRIIDWSHT